MRTNWQASLIALLLGAALVHAQEAPPVVRPADVVCIEEAEGVTRVLIAGPAGLVERVLPGALPAEIPLAEFTPVGELQGRVLAAASTGMVVIQPAESDVVFKYSGGELQRFLEHASLSEATRLAVDSEGGITTLYANPPRLRKFTTSPDGVVGYIEKKLDFLPRDFAIDRHGVVLLDDASGALVRLADTASGTTEATEQELSPLPPMSALSEFGGLVYGTSGDRLTVATGRQLTSWATAPIRFSTDGGRPGLSRSHIFIYDPAAGVVRVRDRLVPATVTFRSDESNLRSLGATYRFLDENGLLATVRVTTERAYPTVEQFLFDHGVLIPVRSVRKEGEAAKDPAADLLRGLFCGWNPALCTADGDVLARPVAAGEELVIPLTNRRRTEAVTKVKLGKTSVQRHLLTRLSSGHERWTASRLAAINPAYSQTVEGYFNRIGFVLATPPRSAFGPGTTFWMDGGIEQIDLACAPIDLATHQYPLLPPPLTLRSSAPDVLVPRDVFADPNAWENLGIDRAEVSYDDVKVIQLEDHGDIGRATAHFSRCFSKAAGDALVVREAIRIGRIRARFYDGKGKRVCPATRRAASDPEWCVAIPEPLYIAYRAERWATAVPRSESETYLTDVSSIKRDSGQNFLAARFEEVNLPIDRWQLVVPAPVAALSNVSSTLLQLEKEYVVDIRSNAPLLSTEALSMPPAADDDPPINEQEMLLKMKAQRSSIEPVEDAGSPNRNPIVAIVEAKDSIDYEHPEFFDDSMSIWRDIDERGDFQPHAAQPASVMERQIRSGDVPEGEHGTHVAGIIAAQRKGFLRGLFPRARLAVIHGGDGPQQIVSSLGSALKAGAGVFGFSIGYVRRKADDPLLKGICELMANDSIGALYVIAAGNEGLDLRKMQTIVVRGEQRPFPYPPIAWVAPSTARVADPLLAAVLFRQVIGVGAWDPEAKDLVPKSNYSKEHVQLVAPGHDVFSTAKYGQYGKASGTSQAVPHVLATAAILFDRLPDPARVKARLIYTAEPLPQAFDDKVWGGILNMRRALMHLEENVIRLTDSGDLLHVNTTTRTTMVTFKDLKLNEPGREVVPQIGKHDVRLSQILRISRSGEALRVIYIDDENRMRIGWVSDVVGKIPCDGMRQFTPPPGGGWQPAAAEYVDRCKSNDGITWAEVQEYVASITTLSAAQKVKFTK